MLRNSNFSQFLQNGIIMTELPFVLAAITALLLIAATRWLHRYVGIHENQLHRRYKYTGLKFSANFAFASSNLAALETPSKSSCDITLPASMSTQPYDALSYVWGNTKNRRPVFINGQLSSLAANLHDALHPATLWDRRNLHICILTTTLVPPFLIAYAAGFWWCLTQPLQLLM
jgi:hypothetical protein